MLEQMIIDFPKSTQKKHEVGMISSLLWKLTTSLYF